MARIITSEHAKQIAKKLKAKKRTARQRSKHDRYDVWDEEQNYILFSFSIRRGSEKDLGHDHLPGELHINAHKTKLLAQCNLSVEEYLSDLREREII